MRRTAVAALAIGASSIALGYVLAFFPAARAAGAWALAIGLAVSCPALIAMAVTGQSDRRRNALVALLASLALLIAGGFAYALLRSGETALLFGLPRATTVLFLTVGVIPLVSLPVVYAVTFDDDE